MSMFVPTPGLNTIVAKSEGVQDALRDKAEQGTAIAQAIAPVLTGAFRDSIHPEPQGEGWTIVADSVEEHGGELDAAFIEFGTSDTPAHHTLSDALSALGST